VSSGDVLEFVRAVGLHLQPAGPETEDWLARLEARHDDVHALVERLFSEDPAAAATACATLWSFWWLKGPHGRGPEVPRARRGFGCRRSGRGC
jgi:hypothetical protein